MELILERSRNAPNMMNPNGSTSPRQIRDAVRAFIERKKMFDDDVEGVKPVCLTARGSMASEEAYRISVEIR